MAALIRERLFGSSRDPGRSRKGSCVDPTGKQQSQRPLSIRTGGVTGIAGGHLAMIDVGTALCVIGHPQGGAQRLRISPTALLPADPPYAPAVPVRNPRKDS